MIRTSAGILVALILCELFVRVFGLAPAIYRFDTQGEGATFMLSGNPILGYEMKPNTRRTEYDCHHTFPFTNSLGFRDIERSLSHSGKRIILLGDSVAAGHGLCDTDQIISRQVERFAESIEIINASVGGYCTRAEVELLRERLLNLAPDIVALLFVENDYVNSNGTIVNALERSKSPAMNRLLSYSALALTLSERIQVLAGRPTALQANQGAIGQSNVESGLTLLKELSEHHGFQPLVITWPYFSDNGILEPKEQFTLRLKPPRTVHKISRSLQIPIFRLSPHFQRDFVRRVQKRTTARKASPLWIYTQGDGIHPNQLASQVAGRVIAKHLRKL